MSENHTFFHDFSSLTDKRLSMVYDFIQPNRVLVDIGTDHAYLPCRAVLSLLTPHAIAADVAIGPLENAKKTIHTFSLENQIETRLSDGLSQFHPEECEEIVFAGMGGILISEILASVPWIKNQKFHLIFQPMTHFEDVRLWLYENDFHIQREKAVLDKNKIYIAFDAVYAPEIPQNFDLFSIYFGSYPQKMEYASMVYTKKMICRLEKKLKGLNHNHSDPSLAKKLEKVLSDQRLKEGFLCQK